MYRLLYSTNVLSAQDKDISLKTLHKKSGCFCYERCQIMELFSGGVKTLLRNSSTSILDDVCKR